MGTNANGYEIRLQLLQMARDMAYEGWHSKGNEAMHNAQLGQQPVTLPEAPSFEEIEALAKKLYGFVQDRGV